MARIMARRRGTPFQNSFFQQSPVPQTEESLFNRCAIYTRVSTGEQGTPCAERAGENGVQTEEQHEGEVEGESRSQHMLLNPIYIEWVRWGGETHCKQQVDETLREPEQFYGHRVLRVMQVPDAHPLSRERGQEAV